jgi:hypothetical protein
MIFTRQTLWVSISTRWGFRALRDTRCDPWSREREKKDSVYPIGDGEKQKARSLSKKGPHDGIRTRTHVGVIKRLDLIIEEKEGTSHQATLVIGGRGAINTGIGYEK